MPSSSTPPPFGSAVESCRPLYTLYITMSIATTSDMTEGEAYLISCSPFKSHYEESVVRVGTPVYHNPDVPGKRVRNVKGTRHGSRFAAIVNKC